MNENDIDRQDIEEILEDVQEEVRRIRESRITHLDLKAGNTTERNVVVDDIKYFRLRRGLSRAQRRSIVATNKKEQSKEKKHGKIKRLKRRRGLD